MKHLVYLTGILAACAASITNSAAADADTPPPPNRHTVIVPYDASKPLDGQEPERFYLDYTTFQDLWQKAKAARIRESTPVDPAAVQTADFTFSSSLHQVEISEDKIEVVARYTLQTRGADWQKIPFAFAGATAREITLDGETAAATEGHILVKTPGQHEVQARYEIAVRENWREAKWKVPGASAAMLAISMPDDRLEPVINGGVPLVEGGVDGKPVFTAALGNRADFSFGRRARGLTSSKLERPRLAEIESILAVRKGVQQLTSQVRFEFPGAEQQAFSIDLDDQFTPVRFSAPNLATWHLNPAENGVRKLEFKLSEPAREGLLVSLVAEASLQQLLGEILFPQINADAVRAEHNMIVASGSSIAVTPKPSAAHRRVVIPKDCVVKDAKTVAAFAARPGTDRLLLETSPAPPERTAKVDYAFQVSGSKLETHASFELTSEAELLDVTLELPEGSTLDRIEGPPGIESISVGQELRLRLPALPTGETTSGVIVGLVQEFENEQETLTLSPIGLPGFSEVRGNAIVVAHAAKETVLRFTEARNIVREVEANSVAGDTFEILPPLVRKHGFIFEEAVFGASLELDNLTAQFDTQYTLLSQVQDTWVSLIYNLDVEIQRGAINTITFSLPEDLPEGQILSAELREARSEVVDGRRIYTVTFQRDVLDFVNFSLRTEIPLTGGFANLVDLEVAGTRRMERYIVLEARTADQVETTLTNVEAIPREHVPYLPQNLVNPKFFQASADWEFAITSEKLESTAGNDAVITQCELTTAFRANGEEWHRAVYKMLNRSLQFLPIKLDSEAELVAVRVSDQEVRADQGIVDGEDVLLVPLIQTRPGELSYSVEIVYRRPSSSQQLPEGKFAITLDDPKVIGQTVEQTFWRVYAPTGFEVADFDGNMEEITDRDQVGSQIAANIAEMNRLSKLATSKTAGFDARRLAQFNCDQLAVGNGNLIKSLEAGRWKHRSSAGGEQEQLAKWAADNARIQQEARGALAVQINWEDFTVQTEANMAPSGDVTVQAGNGDTVVNGGDYFQGDLLGNGGFYVNKPVLDDRNTDIVEKNRVQIGKVQEQVRLNDNISVGNRFVQQAQQQQEAQPQAPPAKPGKKGGKGDFEFQYAQIGNGGKEAERQSNDGPMVNFRGRSDAYAQLGHGGYDLDAPQTMDQSGNISVNAAGNISVQSSNGTQPMAENDIRSYAQIGHGGFDGNADANTNGTLANDPQAQIGHGGRSTESWAQSTGVLATQQSGQSALAALRPKGRVSLRVDFPTNGEPAYFKKLKDHARLKLGFIPSNTAKGWMNWAFFGLALVVVVGGERTVRAIRKS
ncbi:MAG: hypothetical protein ACI8UO_003520 [Verrucomicrobiales bacterium]|jgi:hypothetical protein